MEPKRIELLIKKKTQDISELFKGYTKIKIETVRGNLWLLKDQLQREDAIKIKEGETYDLEGFVQIQNMGFGKSLPTLTGYLE
jgi:hypothetical protein